MPSQTRQSRDSSSPILPQVNCPPDIIYITPNTSQGSNLPTTSAQARTSRTTTNLDNDSLHLFTASLARLDCKPLQAQRYDLSPAQESTLGMLALGAKLERALEKRIVTQDAEGKVKKSEMLEMLVEKMAV